MYSWHRFAERASIGVITFIIQSRDVFSYKMVVKHFLTYFERLPFTNDYCAQITHANNSVRVLF